MAKTSKQEVEIEIFSQDQLSVFNPEVQLDISYLSENLPAKELKALNPLITKLISIQNYKESVKYNPENKKESVELYKEAMKDLKETNKVITDTKSAIKRPLDELGKKVLSIERFSKSIVQDVISDIDKEFEQYVKEEEERKRIAKEKREAKQAEELKKLEDANKEQTQMLLKTNLLNKLKYEIPDAFTQEVMKGIVSYSKDALEKLKVNYEGENIFDSYHKKEDPNNLLSEEEKEVVKAIFDKKISDSLVLINNRIEQLNLEETIEVEKKAEERAVEKNSDFIKNMNVDSPTFESPNQVVFSGMEDPQGLPPLPQDNYDQLLSLTKEYISKVSILKNDNQRLLESKNTVDPEDMKKHKKISGSEALGKKILTWAEDLTN